jgi:hypothetical protein
MIDPTIEARVDPTNAARQQKHRNKLKHDKPIVKKLIATLRELLKELDK